MTELTIEYCGERYHPDEDAPFTIGRSGDLSVDDNPYLHRVILEVRADGDLWLVANVGRQLSATLSDADRLFVAHLAPGGVLPIVFAQTFVRFGAGSTTYEVLLETDMPAFEPAPSDRMLQEDALGEITRAAVDLTPDQKLLVLALAEPALLRNGTGPSPLPTSAIAAERLGWTVKKFNKKLDILCQKLSSSGLRGLHGGPGDLASSRRARLVEYCLSSRMITVDDLSLLGR